MQEKVPTGTQIDDVPASGEVGSCPASPESSVRRWSDRPCQGNSVPAQTGQQLHRGTALALARRTI